MPVLVFNRNQIAGMVMRAEGHIVRLDEVVRRATPGFVRPPDYNRYFTRRLGGYLVTFTMEEQRPGVICRHLSVSVRNGLPNPKVLHVLASEFGFVNELGGLIVWQESYKGSDVVAINLLEPFDGDFTRLGDPLPGHDDKLTVVARGKLAASETG